MDAVSASFPKQLTLIQFASFFFADDLKAMLKWVIAIPSGV